MNSIMPDDPQTKRTRGRSQPLPADPADVSRRYFTETTRSFLTGAETRSYYEKHTDKKPAFTATADRLATKQGDRAAISGMLAVAQARGWTSIRVEGGREFRQEAAIQAGTRGIKVRGYTMTNRDTQEAERRMEPTKQVQQAAQPAAAPQKAPTISVVPPTASAVQKAPSPREHRETAKIVSDLLAPIVNTKHPGNLFSHEVAALKWLHRQIQRDPGTTVEASVATAAAATTTAPTATKAPEMAP